MSLLEKWQGSIEALDTQEEYQEFWKAYFEVEKNIYKSILGAKRNEIKGSISDLAKEYEVGPATFVGFLDGLNTSLESELDLEPLTEESTIEAKIDFEKLLFNMHDAKADWLFGLEEWEEILSDERRTEIRKEYMKSKTVIKEDKIGRNDPCPCGSGKKYKKCCINK